MAKAKKGDKEAIKKLVGMMADLKLRAESGDEGAEDKLKQIHDLMKAHPQFFESEKEASDKHESQSQSNLSEMMVKSTALQNFGAKKTEDVMEIPPVASSRRFNECDIIGNLERDDKGNVITNQDASGKNVDKDGAPTNERGYLIDPATGDVVNNMNKTAMFSSEDLDDRGEVPAPFNVEKHNFNAHEVRGDFSYDRNGKAIVPKSDDGSAFEDKRKSNVSSRGYRLDSRGDMVDNNGRKKFDKTQMTADGDLPKLFNYNGRRFDITDTIGQVDKDQKGNIIP